MVVDMRAAERWQLDGRAPELYERYLVPAMTAMWAVDLVDRLAVRAGQRVLDVACGTGVVAREAAARAGTLGRVAAVDINSGMLAVARSLPRIGGATIDWCESSALELPFSDSSFDVVVCQFGLQFFPDRSVALSEMRRVLDTGGRLGLNVFGPIEHNPATQALADALDRHLAPDASVAKRREHALADPQVLRTGVAEAGFRDLTLQTRTRLVRFPSAAEYVRVQFAATPLAALIKADAQGERLIHAVEKDVSDALRAYVKDDGLLFPQEVHVVLASR
jgi:ubiquinone/menaquinone biosynthesis C-methylase UbiE